MHKVILGHRKQPDHAVMLCKDHNRRSIVTLGRPGHELKLIIPTSTLEAVTSSSLTTAKKIWNNLPADVAAIADPIRFKNAVKGHVVYNLLSKPKIVGNWN
uniref:Uncharacterized protein n=1 Tax=Acrobeloides nanus TaxID=290746 RepID=A0A914D162_9BILA